ncbi:hypothetical protein H8E77_30150 [bacterium]|nr:hypothetical protein [bacterium]
MSPIPLFGLIIVGLAAILIITLITYKALYKKVPPDSALVLSGGKAVRAEFGGMLVNPLIYRTQEISLNTMNLKIERRGAEALITKDSLRVDIVAEFFVKIQKEKDDVLQAAASLGDKTQTPESVNTLLEGKLVGALRAVAATMELQELHEQRQQFQDAVQEACRDDLKQNGFTLETVSITGLDQTPLEQLDENNRFDAVAIRTINEKVLLEKQATEKNKVESEIKIRLEEERGRTETEKLKVEAEIKIQEEQTRKEKESAKLEAGALVAVEEQRMGAEKQKLELEQDLAFAKAQQEQAVKEADIKKAQAVEEAEIKQKQVVEIARIEQERSVQEAEIQQKQLVEKAKIEQARAIEEATIAKDIALIEKNREQKETESDSAIKIAMKLTESESAEIEKLKVSAEKAKAEAEVETAKAVVEAERQAKIKVVEAEGKAEEEYVAKQKIAEAEAYHIMKLAEAELEAAKLEAESIQLLAKAELEEMMAKAEGEKAMIESKNIAEEKILIQEPIMALVENLPEIAERLMKPAEKIESIRVLDMGGPRTGAEGGTPGKIASAIMNAGAAMPIMKEFLNFSGVDTEKLIQKAADYLPGLGKVVKAKEPVPQRKSMETDEQKAPIEEPVSPEET